MAQKRFFNWQDELNSFEFGEQLVGLNKPGRFAGFDTMIDAGGSGINVDIGHNGTGMTKTLENNTVDTQIGVALLNNGTVVHEDAAIGTIAIDSNVGNANVRIDILVAEHVYGQVVGGNVVSYSIIKGDNAGNFPAVANPATQTMIGVFEIVGNGSVIGDVTYRGTSVPLPGGETVESFRSKLQVATTAYIDAADQAEASARTSAINALTNTVNQINSVPQGLISMWSGTIPNIPAGWVLCDGTNNTPNLKGRFVIGYDNTGGTIPVPSAATMGATGGEANVTLTEAQMPAHTHTYTYTNIIQGSGGTTLPGGLGQKEQYNNNVETGSKGSNAAHNNLPPYMVLAYIMKS